MDVIEWHARMRETAPAVWDPVTQSWYIGRFDDVWALLVDDRLGAKDNGAHLSLLTPEEQDVAAELFSFFERWPVFMKMPDHAGVHRTLMPCFKQDSVLHVSEAVATFLPTFSDGTLDSTSLQNLLESACLSGLGSFLGLPLTQIVALNSIAQRLISFAGLVVYDDSVARSAVEALHELADFVPGALRAGESLFTRIVRNAVDAGQFTAEDAVSIYGQMITGFLQPTLSALTYSVCEVLNSEKRRLQYGEAPGAFLAECLRLSTPFHAAPRRALERITVGTAVIEQGARVVLLLAAANRDPRRFPDPEAFVPNRPKPANISFTRGMYACVGAQMAINIIHAVLKFLIQTADTPHTVGADIIASENRGETGSRARA